MALNSDLPSLVAEIGDAIDSHLRFIGLLKDEGLDEHQQKLVDAKRKELEEQSKKPEAAEEVSNDFPAGAQLCLKCNTKAMIKMDGCMTCLNCGDSKCG